MQFGAAFLQSFFPRLIGCQPSRGVAVILVVVFDFFFKEFVGLVVMAHLLVGEEGDESLLESAKEPFDLPFGLR